MPYKFHEPRRHRVPKARYRVRNWAEYDRGLVARGDVRGWISAEAIEGWKAACRRTPGGQRRFSNLAIETVLVLGGVYRLPLRQCEGIVEIRPERGTGRYFCLKYQRSPVVIRRGFLWSGCQNATGSAGRRLCRFANQSGDVA